MPRHVPYVGANFIIQHLKDLVVKILAVLFDAGDILYSKPRRKAAIANFLTTRGYSRPETNDPKEKEMRSQAHAGKIDVDYFMEWLLRHYGVTKKEDISDGITLLRAQQSDVSFFDGVSETLHELKRRGLKLGIVTNTFNPPSEKMVWFKTVGIDTVWDSYADSCELGIVKPEPGIYMAALNPLKINPENAVFVGHAQKEIDGAKKIGMTTVRFNSDPDCNEADFKVDNFGDLLNLELLKV